MFFYTATDLFLRPQGIRQGRIAPEDYPRQFNRDYEPM